MSGTIAIIATIVAITTAILLLFALISNSDRFKPKPEFPEQKQCGVPLSGFLNTDINSKIINGFEAKPNSLPWIVSLRDLNSNNLHFCGGSLIYDQFVLTAAHCVYDSKPSEIGVSIGIHNTNETLTFDNFFRVSAIKMHEDYNNTLLSNDIAVLKLSGSITRSNKVTTICLPASKDSISDVYDKDVVVAGWGSTNGENSVEALSDVLKQANLKVYGDQNICQVNAPLNFDRNRNYCAIDESPVKSNICYGDSGGPLMLVKDNKWYLYGITSYSPVEDEKCNNRAPSYYANVPTYVNWILTAVKGLEF